MALYILFQTNAPHGQKRDSGPWHVGDKSKPATQSVFETVVSVQADGDELKFIAIDFRNIVIPTHKSLVTWNGEMAQFIYDNL